MTLTFRAATAADALFIARGFQMAMLMENVPEEHTQRFAANICVRDDVLYSWHNTLIAQADGQPVGMVTAYDGRYYRVWRTTTMQIVKETLGIDFPGMEDEALPGEYYIDSLAVVSDWRGKGIGRKLLQRAIAAGQQTLDKLPAELQQRAVTLAVEYDNERAKALYASLGFCPAGNLFIFGHDYQKMAINYPLS